MTEILQKILGMQNADNKTLVIYSIIIIIIGVMNVGVQLFINRQNLRNDTKKLKIERKREHVERLYSALIKLQLNTIDNANSKQFKKRINEISLWITLNKILLSQEIYSTSKDILDYFISYSDCQKNKNIDKENKLFKKFIAGYEKL